MQTEAKKARRNTVPKPEKYLAVPLFSIVSVVLLSIVVLLSVNLLFQYRNYSLAIAAALHNKDIIDHASILSYSRAWDFAVIKTSSLFLAFLLIFTGALYVLRSAESRLVLSVESISKGSLETSSPGLVMITLGVVLVSLVLFSKSYVDYQRQPGHVTAEPVAVRNTVPVTESAKQSPLSGGK